MAIVGALPVTLQNGTIADATQVMSDLNSIKNDVNANAAAGGANADITSLSGLTTPLSTTQGGSGSATPGPFVFAPGFRNTMRRNGGLEVWQRGAGGAASIAVAASTTLYTADGWYLTTLANEAHVVSQQAGITDGSQWCAKVLRNAGQTGTSAMIFGFPLDTDELYPLLGKFVRLSFTVKAGANWSPASGSLAVNLAAGTGAPAKVAAFAGRTNPINTAVVLTTSAVRYQFNSAAIIPTNVRQMDMTFQWTPVGTAGADDSFYIDDVQLEVVPAATGYVASDFERLNFVEQLELCYRHYYKFFKYSDAPAQAAGGGTDQVVFFQILGASVSQGGAVFRTPFPMRKTGATITTYNPISANAEIRNIVQAADWSATAVVAFNSPLQEWYVQGTSPAGSGVGQVAGVGVTVDAGI